MMKILRFPLLIVFFICSHQGLFAQGSPGGPTCSDAVPFCTAELNQPFDNCFSGSSDTNCAASGEAGIDYGCLNSTPYPTWYFLQIDQAGDLEFEIIQKPVLAACQHIVVFSVKICVAGSIGILDMAVILRLLISIYDLKTDRCTRGLPLKNAR